jgi:hypothetical protein
MPTVFCAKHYQFKTFWQHARRVWLLTSHLTQTMKHGCAPAMSSMHGMLEAGHHTDDHSQTQGSPASVDQQWELLPHFFASKVPKSPCGSRSHDEGEYQSDGDTKCCTTRVTAVSCTTMSKVTCNGRLVEIRSHALSE